MPNVATIVMLATTGEQWQWVDVLLVCYLAGIVIAEINQSSNFVGMWGATGTRASLDSVEQVLESFCLSPQ